MLRRCLSSSASPLLKRHSATPTTIAAAVGALNEQCGYHQYRFCSPVVGSGGISKKASPVATQQHHAGLVAEMFKGKHEDAPEKTEEEKAKEAFEEREKKRKAQQQATVDKARAPFLAKVEQLQQQASTHKAGREKWKRKREEKKQAERQAKVVWRYVGDELDHVQVQRDFLHWIKFFRYGRDFMVDEALERMNRYFNKDAQVELRLSPKLFRGTPKLMPGFKFPELKVSRMSNFTQPSEEYLLEAKKAAQDRIAAGKSVNRNKTIEELEKAEQEVAEEEDAKKKPKIKDRESTGIKFNSADDKKVLLSSNSFRRPTLVIYANLGGFVIGEGKEQEVEAWKKLLKDPLNYKTSARMDAISGTGKPKNADGTPAEQSPKMANKSAAGTGHKKFVGQAVDVITIRTIDQYVTKSIRHISGLRVRDFASRMNIADVDKTYIGTDLTRQLMKEPPLELQNHLSVYAFLVDHRGKVRWMSSGEPDQREVDVLPDLLQQLEYEFMKANK